MTERDYVLGTEDDEVARLGLQHRVWRPRMLDAWARAGINVGQTVLDVGCGPGYATVDLAEIVGPSGKIVAVERSQRFLDAGYLYPKFMLDLKGETVFAHAASVVCLRPVSPDTK